MCTIDYRYLRPKKAAFLKKWQEDPAFVQREDLTLWRGEKATILPLRRVEGDGFLYNMVRIMVGTLLGISAGSIPQGSIPAIIESKNRSRAGATAPAWGLYLCKVFYDENDLILK